MADPTDADFLALELPSYLVTATTPAVEDEFRGFRIAAPKTLRAGPTLRVPVSAVARFGEENRDVPNPFWDSVSAVVVEVESNRCWVGTLMDPYRVPLTRPDRIEADAADTGADEAAPPVRREASEDDGVPEAKATGVSTRCAHVDLRTLLELPARPGRYEIHFTWGPWASNVVRVAVDPPREG